MVGDNSRTRPEHLVEAATILFGEDNFSQEQNVLNDKRTNTRELHGLEVFHRFTSPFSVKQIIRSMRSRWSSAAARQNNSQRKPI
jgi:hypothetical protein